MRSERGERKPIVPRRPPAQGNPSTEGPPFLLGGDGNRGSPPCLSLSSHGTPYPGLVAIKSEIASVEKVLFR